MADISVMNVGGTDYNIKDSTSRTNSTKAMSLPAYYETGNTASQAYSIVGTPINWKGTLYYTKTTVAKGATWTVGTNLTAATNLGKLVRNIKTYVGSDSKLHFVDLTGADTALNFSVTPKKALAGTLTTSGNTLTLTDTTQNYAFNSGSVTTDLGVIGIASKNLALNLNCDATLYYIASGVFTIKKISANTLTSVTLNALQAFLIMED